MVKIGEIIYRIIIVLIFLMSLASAIYAVWNYHSMFGGW